jgi:membrane peptidoglycan carboxypeptidase
VAERPAGKRHAAKQKGPGRFRRYRSAKKRRLAKMSRRRRIFRRVGLSATWLLGLFAVVTVGLGLLLYSESRVPSPDQLPSNQLATLLYSNGTTMATFGTQDRTDVSLSQVPVPVRDAVIAAEDRGFYSESGVSIRGTVRAALNDLRGGSTQGGSTITQQYVKNAYLNSDQTLSRKLKELAISLKLSRDYSKNTILGYYLNTIYFGRGAYGIQAASQAYFGVNVSQLNLSQGALLAAVIKGPSYYDPRVTPDASKQRWQYVIDGMLSTGKLTQAQHDALKFPSTIEPAAQSAVLNGPLGMVKSQVLSELNQHNISETEINARGLRIQTTIDASAQKAAQSAIATEFDSLSTEQRQEGVRPALTAVRPSDGAVLAYWGNSNGTDFDYANAYHPPGSSFKPYTLAEALTQNIEGKTPAYAISSTFNGSYCVEIQGTQICNDPSDRSVSSPNVRIDFAMKVSLNTVFDGLANAIGPSTVADMAHAAGIRATNNAGQKTLVNSDGVTTFGIGIGDSDYRVRPLDQAVGYATIANGGTEHDPYFVTKVTDSKGALVYEHQAQGTRAMDPRVANDVGLTLKPIAAYSDDPLADGRESGAKTGTAGINAAPGVPAADVGQNSDAWMVGYTPQVSAAVWVGTSGSGPITNSYGGEEYGRDLPGKTWKLFMDAYLQGQPDEQLPTTQMITTGSNIAPVVVPSSAASSSTPPTTVAPPTTPRTTTRPTVRPSTVAPTTAAPTTTPPTAPPTTAAPVTPPATTAPVVTPTTAVTGPAAAQAPVAPTAPG